MVLTLTAWAAITISLKKVLPTTSDLERGIAVPRFVFILTALMGTNGAMIKREYETVDYGHCDCHVFSVRKCSKRCDAISRHPG